MVFGKISSNTAYAVLLVTIAVAIAAIGAHADSTGDRLASESITVPAINPIPSSENSVASGKRVYEQQCVMCHAEDGRGEPGMIGMLEVNPPDLTDARWDHGSTDAALFRIIREGTKTGMEPFARKQNERQTWNVINFLRSLAPSVPTNDRADDTTELHNPIAYSEESIGIGEQQYIRKCVECHGEDGLGHTEMADFLVEQPANLRKEEWKYGTNDAAVFRIVRDGTSSDMPAFEEKLTEKQMWHVVNYLRSIRGEK